MKSENLVVNDELILLKEQAEKLAQNIRSAREILEQINELLSKGK